MKQACKFAASFPLAKMTSCKLTCSHQLEGTSSLSRRSSPDSYMLDVAFLAQDYTTLCKEAKEAEGLVVLDALILELATVD